MGINPSAVAILFVLVACQGSGDGRGVIDPPGDDDPFVPPPDIISIQHPKGSGSGQIGLVGTMLPEKVSVEVRVNGSVRAGMAVIWSSSTPTAMVQSSSLTDGGGIASTTVKLGTTSGSQAIIATVSSVSAQLSVTAAPDQAVVLEQLGASTAFGPVGLWVNNALMVRALDQYGNPVPDIRVDFTVTTGVPARFGNPNPLTSEFGIASPQVKSDSTAGVATISAQLAGQSAPSVVFTLTFQ